MLLTRLLNACHHFPGFVYTGARLRASINTIEVDVRPRQGSKARCSGCHEPGSGYDQMPQRAIGLAHRFDQAIPGCSYPVVAFVVVHRLAAFRTTVTRPCQSFRARAQTTGIGEIRPVWRIAERYGYARVGL